MTWKAGDIMYPDDYKSDFKIISQEQNAAGSCIYAFLQAKKYAYECECCGSNDIASKGFWKKKNLVIQLKKEQ